MIKIYICIDDAQLIVAYKLNCKIFEQWIILRNSKKIPITKILCQVRIRRTTNFVSEKKSYGQHQTTGIIYKRPVVLNITCLRHDLGI